MYAINSHELINEVDFMPLEVKTALVEKLLLSLSHPEDGIDALWMQECDKRAAEIENGVAKLVSGKEVFKKISDRFTDR